MTTSRALFLALCAAVLAGCSDSSGPDNQPVDCAGVAPTSLAVGQHLVLDGVLAPCVELPAGKVLWQERAGGNYSGSPVVAGGKVYCLSEEGEAVVIAAAREFRLLARNPLGEGSRSTPAVAGGRMFLRTYSHLISVGGKAAQGAEAGGR